ncbi:MAG: ribonuclease Z [Lachnospiraceae bacterium]|jgi:ribonuclease Z|nr:ribonuclease Z [Lachnospiraceae bacterium]
MIDVCLLGTGGMMPLPYRWLTSLMVRYNGRSILLDCGEGTQIAMKKKGWSPNPIDVILFTHYHADHISGLPGMLLSMGNADRKDPVLLVGPKGLEHVVNALRVIAPELPFSLKFRELTESEEEIDLPGESDFHIHAYKVNHRVTCYCYSFTLDRAGRFDAEQARSLQIPLPYWSRLQKGETITAGEKTYTPSMVMGPARRGLKIAYATDSRPCSGIVRAAEGADLFICEGMYGEEDKLPKAKEKKHMTFCEAAAIAAKAQPKSMWLTHFSPSEMKPEQYIPEARKIFPATSAGKDGRTLTLNFAEE